jgi:hypothetical protein
MSSSDDFSFNMGSINTTLSNLKDYNKKVIAGLLLVTDTVAKKMEIYAKDNARWTDRTGDARKGLVGHAYWATPATLVCSLQHTMEYGKWLELANEKKYAILSNQ